MKYKLSYGEIPHEIKNWKCGCPELLKKCMEEYMIKTLSLVMTQEDKELLIKDLCARLPYGVKCKYYDCCEGDYDEGKICGFERQEYIQIDGACVHIEEVKPYLFPISNMTKVQEDEWYEVFIDPLSKRIDKHTRQEDLQLQADAQAFGIMYLLKNHFDIYGLIPMGLAIDATGLNIY